MSLPQELIQYLKDPGLFFAMGLVVIVALVSMFQGLKLEKDLFVAAIRGFIQLSAVGFILSWVFSFESLWIVVLVLLSMSLWASFIARDRGQGISHVFWIVWVALLLSTALTLSLLVVGRAVHAEAKVLIPLGGMILGNAMNGAGLTLNRLKMEMELRRSQILVCLSLGASPRQALQDILESVLRASLIPAVDTMKALGVIFMPGMMAGMIIAGQSPLLAVRYQIIVMFMLLASTALTNLIVLILGYRQFFTPHLQLKNPSS
jgi:TIGR00245 family protein